MGAQVVAPLTTNYAAKQRLQPEDGGGEEPRHSHTAVSQPAREPAAAAAAGRPNRLGLVSLFSRPHAEVASISLTFHGFLAISMFPFRSYGYDYIYIRLYISMCAFIALECVKLRRNDNY